MSDSLQLFQKLYDRSFLRHVDTSDQTTERPWSPSSRAADSSYLSHEVPRLMPDKQRGQLSNDNLTFQQDGFARRDSFARSQDALPAQQGSFNRQQGTFLRVQEDFSRQSEHYPHERSDDLQSAKGGRSLTADKTSISEQMMASERAMTASPRPSPESTKSTPWELSALLRGTPWRSDSSQTVPSVGKRRDDVNNRRLSKPQEDCYSGRNREMGPMLRPTDRRGKGDPVDYGRASDVSQQGEVSRRDPISRSGDLIRPSDPGRELRRLEDAVEYRNKQIAELNAQLNTMESYFNKERLEFQNEVSSRAKKLQDALLALERERQEKTNLSQQRDDLSHQIKELNAQLERRENWIRDLYSKIARQDAQIQYLEQQLSQATNECRRYIDRFEAAETRLNQQSVRVFRAYQLLQQGVKQPVTLVLQKEQGLGQYCLHVGRWTRTEIIRFTEVESVSVAAVRCYSIEHWNVKGVSGRLLQWFSSAGFPHPSNDRRTLQVDQTASCKEVVIRPVLIVATRYHGTLAFDFTDDNTMAECKACFESFQKESKTSENEALDAQQRQSLCEIETFLFGQAAGATGFPPPSLTIQTDASGLASHLCGELGPKRGYESLGPSDGAQQLAIES